MIKTNKITGYIILMFSLIVGIVAYSYLPKIIAVHFNLVGNADYKVNKIFIIILPLLWFVIQIVNNLFLRKIKENNFSTGIIFLLYNSIPLTSFLVELILILFAFHKFNVYHVTSVLLGFIFIIIGNLLPKNRTNKVAGIRTKKTLSDPFIWERTQRFSSYVFVACGILFIIFSLMYLYLLSAFIFVFMVASPVIYANYFSKSNRKG